MRNQNGVCKTNNKLRKREHQLSWKKDGQGREYCSCDKCGFLEVKYNYIEK